jgi:hypothetical protein
VFLTLLGSFTTGFYKGNTPHFRQKKRYNADYQGLLAKLTNCKQLLTSC